MILVLLGKGCQAQSPLRSIDKTAIEFIDEKIVFVFQASLFHQQIRIMVGTLQKLD